MKQTEESLTLLRITVKFLLRVLAAAHKLEQLVDIRFTILDLFIAVIAEISFFHAITTLVQNYPQVPATLAAHIYAFVAATEFLLGQQIVSCLLRYSEHQLLCTGPEL